MSGMPNWKNRTLFVADNLPVMRGMDSESVDLIVTDPPFNAKRLFNAPLGSRRSAQQFDDRWRWDEVTDEWHDVIAANNPAIKEIIEAAVVIEGGSVDSHTGKIDTGRVKNSIAAFIAWMAPRVVEMKRILKPHGTLYLHCDKEANAYLRLLLDAIFGRSRFRNELIWCYRGAGVPARDFSHKHDTVFRYSVSHKNSKNVTFNVDDVRTEYAPATRERFRHKIGNVRGDIDYGDQELNPLGKHPDDWITIQPIAPSARRRSGWKTQKPPDLYIKFVAASSNLHDVVLDPFAGCGTTCAMAEKLGRQWVGIDIDPAAEEETLERLRMETDMFRSGEEQKVNVRRSPPRRSDIQHIPDNQLRQALWANQSKRCANPYCDSGELRAVDLELDHRIPKSRGGADDVLNRIGLCSNCNRRKGRKAWGQFLDEERSRQPHPTIGVSHTPTPNA